MTTRPSHPFMWILYQCVVALALLLAGPFLLLTRGAHYLATLPGRLGHHRTSAPQDPLWLHAVSVGEVAIAETLVRALPRELPLVLTTITPTGQARAKASLADRAAVTYLPFELGPSIGRFLRRFRPRALVLMEGDLWPLLMRRVKNRNLPIVVVNGRISDRSFERMRRLRRVLGPVLAPVDRFGVQTEEDRRRLIALGVAPERVTRTGNLKFDAPEPAALPDLERHLERLAGGRAILIAGSTMEGEEEQVLEAYRQLGSTERALLVLAPRHPERWGSVAQLLDRLGIDWAARSSLPGEGRPAVVLLDSLGELAALYRLAAAGFVGGTLVPTGGHNPIEPARCGVPIVVGPSMTNFREIAEQFSRAGAWEQVPDAAHLAATWDRWLLDESERRQVGGRAAALVAHNRGALEQTLRLLAETVGAIDLESPGA